MNLPKLALALRAAAEALEEADPTPSPEPVPDVLDTAGAARFLKLSAKVLERKARKHEVPAHRMGRSWRFKRAELEAWVMDGRGAA